MALEQDISGKEAECKRSQFVSWHPSPAPVGLPNPTGMTVGICQSPPSMKDARFFLNLL